MSAQAAGWGFAEWRGFVLDPNSNLGRQAAVRAGRASLTMRPLSQVEKSVRLAWEAGERNRAEDDGFIARRVVDVAAQLRRVLEDPDWTSATGRRLGTVDRRVLAFSVAEAERRGFVKVALPWRTVVAETGVGERAVKNALQRLHDAELLVRRSAGRSGAGGEARRAAVYELLPSTTNEATGRTVSTGNTSMGPPVGSALAMGPVAPALRQTPDPDLVMGPPGARLSPDLEDLATRAAAWTPEQRRAAAQLLMELHEQPVDPAPRHGQANVNGRPGAGRSQSTHGSATAASRSANESPAARRGRAREAAGRRQGSNPPDRPSSI